MFLRYIFKHIKRGIVYNILFCLLLALSGALVSLAAGMWFSAYKGVMDIDRYFTTIAIPETSAIRAYASNYYISRRITEFETQWGETVELVLPYVERTSYELDGRTYYNTFQNPGNADYFGQLVGAEVTREVFQTIESEIFESGLFDTDDRRLFNAYVPGLITVSVHEAENVPSLGVIMDALPQSMSAFIVTCTGVDETYRRSNYTNYFNFDNTLENTDFIYDEDTGELIYPVLHPFELERRFEARVSVDEVIYLHNAYPNREAFNVTFSAMNMDGSLPMELGKRYLVVGRYMQSSHSLMMNTRAGVVLRLEPLNRRTRMLKVDELTDIDEMNAFNERFFSQVGVYTSTAMINGRFVVLNDKPEWYELPIAITAPVPIELSGEYDIGYPGYTWFEIEGSLEEALAGEEGKFIETALNVAKYTVNSIMAITTNNVESLVRFNQRRLGLVEGRYFTEAEYQNGDRVVIISDQLAGLNGLKLGDTLSMELYPGSLNSLRAYSSDAPAWIPSFYYPTMELTEPMEYEIIGIFKSLPIEQSDQAISANMVIIPDNSIGWVEPASDPTAAYYDYQPPLTQTIIVPNGDVAETLEQINALTGGYGMFFRFYDQGFTAVLASMTNLRTGMAWIFALTVVGWVLAALIFISFYIGRKHQEARLLYAMGVGGKKRLAWVMVQAAVVIVVSCGLAVGASLPLYANILERAAVAVEDFTNPDRYAIFSDASEAEGIRNPMPLYTYPYIMVVSVGACAIILFAAGVKVSNSRKLTL